MSSSAPRSGERMIQQDFIARIRYSNALPPPPNPPKLLDIPNTGLASGQYTNPGFASRLAREQPLNIEVDAELGMPLDLVGMPGVFDGDESSIQAPPHPPPVHPHDKPLLRGIAALGKLKVAEANVSFLRRTEYISSTIPKRVESNNPRALLARAKKPLRKQVEAAADSPAAIKRKIDKGFEVAAQELRDTKRLKHPTKKHLKLVDAAPLIPDLDAFPDSGAYVTIKFLTNPVSSTTKYDKRLLKGLFRPIDKTAAEDAEFEAAMEAYELDPDNIPKPQNMMNYDFFLGQSAAVSEGFQKKFDVENPDNGDEDLYTHEADGNGCFQFNRLRAYETATEVELDHPTKYDDEILLVNNDDDTFPRQKAVYYYPVMQKSTIRPQRTKNIARGIMSQDEEEQIIDQLDVTVEDATEELREDMKRYKENPLGHNQEEEEEDDAEQQQQAADAQLEEDAEGDDAAEQNGRTSGRQRSYSEDRDAEGDDDED